MCTCAVCPSNVSSIARSRVDHTRIVLLGESEQGLSCGPTAIQRHVRACEHVDHHRLTTHDYRHNENRWSKQCHRAPQQARGLHRRALYRPQCGCALSSPSPLQACTAPSLASRIEFASVLTSSVHSRQVVRACGAWPTDWRTPRTTPPASVIPRAHSTAAVSATGPRHTPIHSDSTQPQRLERHHQIRAPVRQTQRRIPATACTTRHRCPDSDPPLSPPHTRIELSNPPPFM